MIDPFANVKFPIVDPLDPTNEPVIVVPVTAAAVLAPIITLSILDVPVPSIFTAPLAVKPTVVVVPFTCNVVDGSEVPIPTRLFVTSRYSRFVSNARSVPFLVKLDFSTDPDIRPMAILGSPYNNVSTTNAVHSLISLPADHSNSIYTGIKKGRPKPPFNLLKSKNIY